MSLGDGDPIWSMTMANSAKRAGIRPSRHRPRRVIFGYLAELRAGFTWRVL